MLARRTVLASFALVLAVPTAPASAAEGDIHFYPYVLPAGDLDGDGLPDTVSFHRTAPTQEIGGVGSVGGMDPVVTARRGSDGEVLWERSLDRSEILPAPLGSGGDGVLIVRGPTTGWGGSMADGAGPPDQGSHLEAGAANLTLTALAGDGTDLWTRTFSGGTSLGGGTGTQMGGDDLRGQGGVVAVRPLFAGLLQATPSSALDMLVAVNTRVEADAVIVSRTEAVVVDGATGETEASFQVSATGSRTTARTAPDLDGDGLDDVLILRAEGRGSVSAHRGVDGTSLWANPADVVPQMFYGVDAVGDVTGDGVPELSIVGVDGIMTDDFPTRLSLLDGGMGSTLFTDEAALAVAIGDLTGDGLSEVLTQDSIPDAVNHAVGVRYRIHTPSGELLRERSYRPDGPEAPATGLTVFANAGDLGGDATLDSGHDFEYEAPDGSPARQAVAVDGVTLEPLFEGEAGLPLRASLDGAGDDLALVRLVGSGTVRVAGQDGATGEVLWSTELPAEARATRLAFSDVRAADVDGDGTADVIVNVYASWSEQTPTGSAGHGAVHSWVLSGTDGDVLWSV